MVKTSLEASDRKTGLTLSDLYAWVQTELMQGTDPRARVHADVGFRGQVQRITTKGDQ